jgi:predicted AAA+ superfamily ATPase
VVKGVVVVISEALEKQLKSEALEKIKQLKIVKIKQLRSLKNQRREVLKNNKNIIIIIYNYYIHIYERSTT